MRLFELFYTEAAGDKIVNDPKLSKMIAIHWRDDPTIPLNMKARAGARADDKTITQVFVSMLDQLEARGSQGVQFSRNGQYHDWLAKVYASGGTDWEDIDSRAPKALYGYTILQRRKLLDKNHSDLNRYGSVYALERYIDTHYRETLDKVVKDEKFNDLVKNAESVKIADTEDYLILIPLNRGAACKYGKGTRWCTSSTDSDNYYNRYSSQGPLVIILSKKHPEDKYQLHAESYQFLDASDSRFDADEFKQKYPNAYNDIVAGMKANAAAIEEKYPDISKHIADLNQFDRFWVKGTPQEQPAEQ